MIFMDLFDDIWSSRFRTDEKTVSFKTYLSFFVAEVGFYQYSVTSHFIALSPDRIKESLQFGTYLRHVLF
jgi:hypothetical protein